MLAEALCTTEGIDVIRPEPLRAAFVFFENLVSILVTFSAAIAVWSLFLFYVSIRSFEGGGFFLGVF